MWQMILLISISSMAEPATPNLVSVQEPEETRLVVQPAYHQQHLMGSSPVVLVRPEVLERLLVAAQSLPPGYSLMVLDGYRNRLTQTHLYNKVYEALLREHRLHWSKKKLDRKLDAMVLKFVADPTGTGPQTPPHLTGGAVDVVLLFNGQVVDLGAAYDETSAKARTDYYDFKRDERSRQISANRKILTTAMRSAGLANYPDEYWHWEYGTVFWMETTGTQNFVPFEAIENCTAVF